MIICSPQLGLSPVSALGGEVYDREVLTRLAKQGHQVKVLLPKNKPHDKPTKNLKFSFAPLRHITPPHLYNLFLFPHIYRLAREQSIDILRIHVPEFFGPSVGLFKKLFPQIPIVGHYHLDEAGFTFNLVNRLFLNSCDLVVADSRYLAKQIKKKFQLPDRKISVVHCGTDIGKIKPGKKDPQLVKKWHLHGQKVILYLGLFIKRKNPSFLIKVFSQIKKKQPNTKLIMIGKGPEEKKLKALAKSLNLNRDVIFPGPKYEKEKVKYYQTADVFAFASHNEGFVLSVLEAMAAGLPLVLPDSVSFPESVAPGINGYLAQPNSLKDWVNKLSQIISNGKLQHKMSHEARKRAVKEFSWNTCAEKNLRAYRTLVK